MSAAELDYTFRAMGSEIRLLLGGRLRVAGPDPLEAADRERAFICQFSDRLSRFRSESELSELNRDQRPCVPVSPLLRAAVTAAVWAAERSGGLVDPTLVGPLERCGYDRSLDGEPSAPLSEALALAPARRPAQPHPAGLWRTIRVDDQAGTITRPPGVMIDTGGTGKGLCADAVALRLAGYTRFAVDCGGDVAIGGIGAQLHPYEVEIEHPLTLTPIGALAVDRGGIATSGINVRIWRRPDGGYAHHLLDPSSGQPVWSGLIGATALGDGALEAETLSKLALLLGPEGARDVLAARGGVIVHDDGSVETIGPATQRLKSVGEPAVAGARG